MRWLVTGILVLAVVGVGAAWRLQEQRLVALRSERELALVQKREQAALRAEHRRLQERQAGAAERAQLEAAAAVARQLEKRIEELKGRLNAAERPAPAAEVPKQEAVWPSKSWHYAGRATPRAALESALWAATGGEVEVLAGLLVLDGPARRRAEMLLGELPEPGRSTYRTPERLIALLAAKDVPLGAAHVASEELNGEGEATVRVRLENESGVAKAAKLTLRQTPAGWGVVVPERAVVKYAEMLKGAEGVTVGGGRTAP